MNLRTSLLVLTLAALGCGSSNHTPTTPPASANSSGGDRAEEGGSAAIVHGPADGHWHVWGCRGTNCRALTFTDRPLGNEDCVSLLAADYDSFRVQDATPTRTRHGICYRPFTGSITVDETPFAPDREADGDCAEVTVLRAIETTDTATNN